MKLRRMRPSRNRRLATNLAVLIPMAKPIPCAGKILAVFTPLTPPAASPSAPPQLPALSAAGGGECDAGASAAALVRVGRAGAAGGLMHFNVHNGGADTAYGAGHRARVGIEERIVSASRTWNWRGFGGQPVARSAWFSLM